MILEAALENQETTLLPTPKQRTLILEVLRKRAAQNGATKNDDYKRHTTFELAYIIHKHFRNEKGAR